LLLSACSGSGSDSADSTTANPESDASSTGDVFVDSDVHDDVVSEPGSITTSGTDTQSTNEPVSVAITDPVVDPASELPEPSALTLTRVIFDVTVPAYVSDSLQVRLLWGEKELVAAWVVDETWTISDDFPVDTENPLTVTFSDNNGAISLASFETDFRTGISASESFQISANQFDSNRWDSDGDGQSNLEELLDGTDPLFDDFAELDELLPPELEFVADKTFRLSWQPTEDAEYYRVMENADGVSGFTQISEDLDASTLSFDHRVALYSRVSARYLIQSCRAANCVNSDVQFVSGTLDDAIGYIKASNTGGGEVVTGIGAPFVSGGDRFGSSVSVSADGNTLAIGAPGEDSAATGINGDQEDNSALDSGAVYVFARIDGEWQQQAYLKASNTEARDNFGGTLEEAFNTAVSLSADGNTLAVGAPGEDSIATGVNGDQNDNSTTVGYRTGAGAVYVFTRSAGVWRQQAYLKASNTRARDGSDVNDQFGMTVTLNADGNTLAVGAPREHGGAEGVNGDQSDFSVVSSGAVYVFTRNNETWQQQAYIKASNPGRVDLFGQGLSISADGDTLAVGAINEGSASTGVNGSDLNGDDNGDYSGSDSGAAYIFVRSNGSWQQQAYIKASNAGRDDHFGRAVSLSADGNTMAVGATEEDSNATGVNGDQSFDSGFGTASSGAVYIFTRDGMSWQQQAYVKASNTSGIAQFGGALSLNTDGSILAVGARGERSAANGINGDQFDSFALYIGATYMFERSNGDWQQSAYLKASNNVKGDAKTSTFYGLAVSLSADGKTLAVGADEEGSGATGINGDQFDRSGAGSGAVFLY